MMNILASRTPREQWLIYGATALFILFAGWQIGVRPVLQKKSAAQQAQTIALRDFDIVQRGLPRMGNGAERGQRAFDRGAIITAARNANVAISRVQPGTDNSLQVWFEEADATSVYRLLSTLRSTYAVSIDRVQITRRDSGRVSAQITLTSQ